MTVHPTRLERIGDERLGITWSDGTQRVYVIRDLRRACPCATCREKKDSAPAAGFDRGSAAFTVLSPEETLPLRIRGMTPVGNYAYAIAFSDGHETGIYSFEFLRELGESA